MYTSYELSPIKTTGDIVEVVEDEKDATMWAVYGRTEGLAEWIADFSEKEYAQLFYNMLIAR